MPRAFRKVLIGSFHPARQADNGERDDPMCKRVPLYLSNFRPSSMAFSHGSGISMR